jgi:acyl-CoA synthetase (AMP-forming)/AMP-acid ligase II
VVTYLRPEDQLRTPGSCGRPIEDEIDIRILDADKNPVPAGQVGELYVKSPYLLDGYHNNPEATQACFHQGYFTVGDMGYVDEQGYYYIVDRAVDMVISGGVNIYPAEIEEVLYRRADLNAAAVIGVPDPQWGEKLVAYVVPRPGAAVGTQEIMDYIGDQLATYKRPKEVVFVDALPTSSTGKVLKRELRKSYQTGQNPQAA